MFHVWASGSSGLVSGPAVSVVGVVGVVPHFPIFPYNYYSHIHTHIKYTDYVTTLAQTLEFFVVGPPATASLPRLRFDISLTRANVFDANAFTFVPEPLQNCGNSIEGALVSVAHFKPCKLQEFGWGYRNLC